MVGQPTGSANGRSTPETRPRTDVREPSGRADNPDVNPTSTRNPAAALPVASARPWSARPLAQSGLRPALEAVGVALLALYVGTFAIRNVPLQGDLRTYWAAGRAASTSVDPYVPHHLATMLERPAEPFVYPPFLLALCVWLTFAPRTGPLTAAAGARSAGPA